MIIMSLIYAKFFYKIMTPGFFIYLYHTQDQLNKCYKFKEEFENYNEFEVLLKIVHFHFKVLIWELS